MPTRPVITFLSDYGLADEFVGVCHGVIARICPQATVIDLTHGVSRHDVHAGALILERALEYMPVGVHLAVVDPGVGGARRAVALRLADGRRLVGPDNGLLSPAAAACGGVTEAVDIGGSRFALEPVSATFHGRDIFAPVAAALASGAELSEAGDAISPASLAGIALPRPRPVRGALVTHVLHVDGFGNVSLDATADDLESLAPARENGDRSDLKLSLRRGGGKAHMAICGKAFGDAPPGGLLIYEDSSRRLAVAINEGDAAGMLGLAAGDELRIRRR